MTAEGDQPQVAAPEAARREMEGLVERFARNLDVYTRPDYKETQVRVEFIDPFFEALGWDVRNVHAATIPADKKVYQRQIESTDEQIDELAYELYGLSEEEIAIVQGAGE